MSPSRVALSDVVVGGMAVYSADLDGGFVSYAGAVNNYAVGQLRGLGGGDGGAWGGCVSGGLGGGGRRGVWGRGGASEG